MKNKNFHLISLGCAKNTVDSDSMAQLLIGNGFEPHSDPDQAGVLIVNTCGFIGPAKEESLQVLGELAANKRPGQLLIAAGCLTQRYGAEVARQVPGIDGILGTRRWMDIVEVVRKLRKQKHPQPLYHLPQAADVGRDDAGTMRVSLQGSSAYIKIADGCRRPCAFCAIPLIKGSVISRPMDAIIAETRLLQQKGVRETILIAQDTTDYGHDQGLKNGLVKLLNRMTAEVPEMDWIRIMYAYPGYVSDELIDTIAAQPQILPYLDIPLQHGHPDTLKRMRRPANIEWVYRTIEKMRKAMPELAIRTTFIVGYPGETEAEFQALLDFTKEMKFDRVGAFTFSFEPGTFSEPLGDPIPQEVKQERLDRLMTLQQGISLRNNQAFIDQTLDVLIDGFAEDDEAGTRLAVGRSYRDAPEIDGLVFVEPHPKSTRPLQIGQIIPVKISGAMTYDLTGIHNTQEN